MNSEDERAWRAIQARRPQPEPPQNVCLILADDTIIPLDCVFVGYDSIDGAAVWVAQLDTRLEIDGARVHLDHGPDNTRLIVAVTQEL